MIAFLRYHAFALCSGVLLALCFPSFHWYPIAWVALVPLFYRSTRCRTWEGALQFFVAGWIFHSVLLQWLITNIFWAGGWAVIGYQLLCIVLALFWAVLGALWAWAHQRAPRVAGAGCLATLWLAMEWGQGNLFTGFGWGALGYSQGPDLAVAQWGAVGSVSLVSLFVVLVNALAALMLAEKRLRIARGIAIGAILLLSHVFGALLLGEADYDTKPFTAGVFQSDYPQELKWDREYAEEMVQRAVFWSKALAASKNVDLFVWPEALVTGHYESPELKQWMVDLVLSTGSPLFTGSTRHALEGPEGAKVTKSYNSSIVMSADGAILDYYDKVHLAPFGEYMPFDTYLPFLRQIVPVDVDAGAKQKVLAVDDYHLGPLICFEVLFSPMAERLRRDGADSLVVVTNLGWFGASNAIPQEFELARMRAIETRLPLIHSANTGFSGVFDPWGRFQAVNGVVDDRGRFRPVKEIPLLATRMHRMIDALPVASPGRRPIPYGPVVFPWIALVGALVLLIAVALAPAQALSSEPSESRSGKQRAGTRTNRGRIEI